MFGSFYFFLVIYHSHKNLKAVKDGDKYKYVFTFHAVTGESYILTPTSETLLFNPSSLKVVGPDDCQDNTAVFLAEQGKVSFCQFAID